MAAPHVIEMRLREVRQLFNSMDPSPFREKDLDQHAEDFIVEWAQERHMKEPLSLMITLESSPDDSHSQATIAEAVHHYFEARAAHKRRELKELLRFGRRSLLIGLVFLVVCLGIVVEAGEMFRESPFLIVLRESIIIAGWVAMWKPMEVFLYDWWPIVQSRRLFVKLSRMPIEVRTAERGN